MRRTRQSARKRPSKKRNRSFIVKVSIALLGLPLALIDAQIILSIGLLGLPLWLTNTQNFESEPSKWVTYLMMAEAIGEQQFDRYLIFLIFWILLNLKFLLSSISKFLKSPRK